MENISTSVKKIFILALSLLFISSLALAETIQLKSGKIVVGKAVEKTDKYIKMEIAGVPVTFYKDEIENWQGENIEAITTLTDINKQEWYANAFFAFKIKKMQGWKIEEAKDEQQDPQLLLLAYSKKSKDDNFENNVVIIVTKHTKDWGYKTLNYLKQEKNEETFISSTISRITNTVYKRYDGLRVIQEPKNLLINDREAVGVTIEGIDRSKRDKSFIYRLMYFRPEEVAENLIICTVIFECKPEEYNTLYPEVEAGLSSIVIGK